MKLIKIPRNRGRGKPSLQKRQKCVTALIAFVLLAFGASVFAAAKEPERYDFRRPEIIPAPKEMTYESSIPVRIESATQFVVACPDAAAAAWVKDKVAAWFGLKSVAVAADRTTPTALRDQGDEGYSFEAAPGRIAIGANTLQGVKWAMHALRQAAERESVGRTLQGWWLPALKVRDRPALAFRGIHFCWFPECSVQLIERQIRIAACYRFNYVVLENWGVFKSERHPYLAVPNAPLTVPEAKRLAALAKDLGVTLIPQVNIYGHAALQRARGGKHTTLDYGPEHLPLFEPGGWNWCLSNPEVPKVVQELIVEMHEAFGSPPFFHIGCDEADPPTCPTCRAVKPYARLVEKHITEVVDILRQRGARAMMWHDMLLEKGKWSPFYAHGDADEAKMADTLAKDIVVCDWYYGSDPAGNDKSGGKSQVGNYPTLDHFAAKGFSVLTCPWRETKGIVAQAKYVREKGMFGLLETIWHHYRGLEFVNMVEISACAAWGAERNDPKRRGRPFATNWRQCGWDMGVPTYEETGFCDHQVTRDID